LLLAERVKQATFQFAPSPYIEEMPRTAKQSEPSTGSTRPPQIADSCVSCIEEITAFANGWSIKPGRNDCMTVFRDLIACLGAHCRHRHLALPQLGKELRLNRCKFHGRGAFFVVIGDMIDARA
jgi:hypothetical protein